MDWKGVVNGMLFRLGYRVYRIGQRQQYTLNPPYDFATYSPWFEDWFQDIYAKCRAHTLMKEDSAYVIRQFSRHCSHLDGDFAECGVYRGGVPS